MDPAQALADLTELSSQIEAAVLFDRSGSTAASTLGDEAGARRLVESAQALLAGAESVRGGGGRELTQLQAAMQAGAVFVVREGERVIAATTSPEPTVGLVFYDLRSCLRGAAEGSEPEPGAKPKRARRKEPDAAT